MATLHLPFRRPLVGRSLQNPSNPSNPSPNKQSRVLSGSNKRAHSPEHPEHATQKRVRPTMLAAEPTTVSPTKSRNELLKEKARRIAERDAREAEFRKKFRKEFPGWTFYIDSENLGHKVEQQFKTKILHLGGTVDDFFSSAATHLITDRAAPKATADNNKENKGNSTKAALRSPIKLVGRGPEDPACSIISKATEYGMKIWSSTKLDSVLSRCLVNDGVRTPSASRIAGPSAGPQRSLSRLLQNEKIHGTTERDPTQKRHDFRYFTRGSCFVLVEDMNQELATMAAHEYPVVKDKAAKKPWPVLYCHPLARNPFGPFDDRERRRYEKHQVELKEEEEMDRQYKEKKKAMFRTLKRKAERTQTLKAAGKANAGGTNLRKSVSVSNLRRRLSHPVTNDEHEGFVIDLDGEDDDGESANASGYNASGAGMNYMAASGNSVGITSTTGTTSTTGRFQRPLAMFPDKFGRHVVTSLKVSAKEKIDAEASNSRMGPPSKVPERVPMLRKSKSTNTLRLPKREEGAKPGYCESCRVKFEDFSVHTVSNRHRKFGANSANFAALDTVLDRLQRRTHGERWEMEQQRARQLPTFCSIYKARLAKRNIDLSSP